MTQWLSEKNDNNWTVADSVQLYGPSAWGAGYFSINDQGNACINVTVNEKPITVAITDIVEGMKSRGLDMPCVLRIENLLDERIRLINDSFADAMQRVDYRGFYRGVFPIKVNQQYHVIEEIASFGKRYKHGLEAGSKAELLIALSQLNDFDSLIICNGYKDEEFIELGLYAIAMGYNCFFVIESSEELETILAQSNKLGVDPLIGIRVRLATTVDGHWSGDSGDGSIFGVSTAGILRAVEILKAADKLDCLQLLHCHLGSQIPNIRNVRIGIQETCQYYAGLIAEGAPMGYLDIGGGLAVDYDGSQSNTSHSMNYGISEYCTNVIETVIETLDPLGIEHPHIVSESGRSTVAYSSMLLFNILSVRSKQAYHLPAAIDDEWPEALVNLFEAHQQLSLHNVQETFNDAIYYRDEVRQLFQRGQASLRERAMAEEMTLAILNQIRLLMPKLSRIPQALEDIPKTIASIYYGNFSLFQSLPDVWAIDQVFPIMPIHRLDEFPSTEAIIADLTCDCDGRIDRFILNNEYHETIPLHALRQDEEYYLGVFLVGAYQETLGDLHNLFGDTNVVSVHINGEDSFEFRREFEGDSIADVLSYVEYTPAIMLEQLRKICENAVQKGKITPKIRKSILGAFRQSLQGYTYFER
ncbi:biosynthetic arginine decarboxylase [Ostreibacterium oceani]|uniref:Arginine decarboxylase n=1 Tax=Ostreibacterium oceani TaxID=2654998 RepID=A0A6N7F055_9GAMM|nr:biosynthetic arginine decarboxylase [Ostreibacterium oceani]MPV87009.1 biosynthetic arginine decarboxylase [Ostreibacterium oceani]